VFSLILPWAVEETFHLEASLPVPVYSLTMCIDWAR